MSNIEIFLKNKKKRSVNMVVNDIRAFQRMSINFLFQNASNKDYLSIRHFLGKNKKFVQEEFFKKIQEFFSSLGWKVSQSTAWLIKTMLEKYKKFVQGGIVLKKCKNFFHGGFFVFSSLGWKVSQVNAQIMKKTFLGKCGKFIQGVIFCFLKLGLESALGYCIFYYLIGMMFVNGFKIGVVVYISHRINQVKPHSSA